MLLENKMPKLSLKYLSIIYFRAVDLPLRVEPQSKRELPPVPGSDSVKLNVALGILTFPAITNISI
jgi:hypothetical protein